MEWKTEYEIDNLMVDREHQELIKLVNLLLAADNNKDSGLAVKGAYEALARYMHTHFKNEEALLESVNSPHLPSMQEQHTMLRQELKRLLSEDLDKPTAQTMHGLAQWCEHRLVRHFIINDSLALQSFPFVDNAEIEL